MRASLQFYASMQTNARTSREIIEGFLKLEKRGLKDYKEAAHANHPKDNMKSVKSEYF